MAALENLLSQIPEESKDAALALACLLLSDISNGKQPPPPSRPFSVLVGCLQATGTLVVGVDTPEEAEALAAAARKLGIQATTDAGSSKTAAAEAIAKAAKR